MGRQTGKAALSGMLLAAALAIGQPATADERAASSSMRTIASAGAPQTHAGAYLAGSLALVESDLDAAASFLSFALAHDPTNPSLMRRTFAALLSSGRLEEGIDIAARLLAIDQENQLAHIAVALHDGADGDYTAAADRLDAIERNGISRYVLPLLEGWALAGVGDRDGALESLGDLRTENAGFRPVAEMHKALVLDLLGEDEAADAAYRAALDLGRPLGLVEAAGAFYQRLGDTDRARAIYEDFRENSPQSMAVDAALERLQRGEDPMPVIETPQDGMAEALFQLATIFQQEGASDLGLIYVRLALYLNPELSFARVLLADLLSDRGQHEAALVVYRATDPNTPAGWSARLRAAVSLGELERADEALALLAAMAEEQPQRSEPLVELGDLQRSMKRFDEAVRSYDDAAARTPQALEDDWIFLYKRGIALERSQQWERAEVDLLRAVDLNPGHPHLLNYLGYSWIDRGENLERGEAMIRRAIELLPNDGYLIDSLGWVYFRTGRLERAVETLEQAVELRPEDPVINDHLGDAYWTVGRRNEAYFQWRRALRNAEDRELVLAIEKKLADGLTDPGIIRGAVSRSELEEGGENAQPVAR